MLRVIFATVVVVGILMAIHWLFREKHTWKYRNPYSRTCTKCGQHEVEHCWSMDPSDWRKGWWEVFKDGDGKCEKVKSK